jgi:hypothetical protein
MRLISAIITIIILSAILEGYLPWWVIAPVAFIVSYLFRLRWHQGLLAGFLGLLILWGGIAFFIDHSNQHILSDRVSVLFFKSVKPHVLVLMTGIIGGLVAGFAGMTGGFLVKK